MDLKVFIITVIVLIFYFAPTVTAIQLKNKNSKAIFWLNFLLGWTLIGWCVAVVWAYKKG